jgi:hypothetical protein
VLRYSPYKVHKNEDGTNREYEHICLPKEATLAPIILSSDKTNLTRFSGDKVAWPVYLSIGNIEKVTRRQPTARAMVLVGYIPVCKLECFSKKKRAVEGYQLFHEYMRTLLEPLIKAGTNGVDMDCADDFIRTIFPILSAYIADYPEQCLVACCKENACPTCLVKLTEQGAPIRSVLREQTTTLEILGQQSHGEKPDEYSKATSTGSRNHIRARSTFHIPQNQGTIDGAIEDGILLDNIILGCWNGETTTICDGLNRLLHRLGTKICRN